MNRNDPTTGKFVPGNPGRPKGRKNVRTLLWEDLGTEIMERHTDRFNALLDRLWDSPDLGDQAKAADLFLKLAEFFKPKLQRVYASDLNTQTVPVIQVVVQPPTVKHDEPDTHRS